ncbi:MAG: RNA polymerase sigma-70 factor [Balneolaceae bacterium]|nr:RNA polymerase sigma-70 factor [Balneolaceae bacterium]
MKQPTDKQIESWARKISESDREAFNCFFRSMYPRLVHFAMRYLRSKAEACDIVQDAFVKLWEKRETVDPNRSVKAFIYQIVRNLALNHIRDHSDETVGLDELNESSFEPGHNPVPVEEYGEEIDLIKKWIRELPDRQREAFTLSRFDGLDHDEIAGVMEISSNTVNNHIVSALDYLRKRWEDYQQQLNNTLRYD